MCVKNVWAPGAKSPSYATGGGKPSLLIGPVASERGTRRKLGGKRTWQPELQLEKWMPWFWSSTDIWHLGTNCPGIWGSRLMKDSPA